MYFPKLYLLLDARECSSAVMPGGIDRGGRKKVRNEENRAGDGKAAGRATVMVWG